MKHKVCGADSSSFVSNNRTTDVVGWPLVDQYVNLVLNVVFRSFLNVLDFPLASSCCFPTVLARGISSSALVKRLISNVVWTCATSKSLWTIIVYCMDGPRTKCSSVVIVIISGCRPDIKTGPVSSHFSGIFLLVSSVNCRPVCI